MCSAIGRSRDKRGDGVRHTRTPSVDPVHDVATQMNTEY
jgi:hypothetical protein